MSNYNFKQVEKEISKKWRELNLLKLLQIKNRGGKPYFLLEGPPYANAKPHVGHLRNIFYKDLNQRYQFMMGRAVLFTAGYDTHGLPIENMVEKKLGFKNKKDILKFGLKNFTKECKKLTAENMDLWKNPYNKYGCWIGWDDDPYLTYNNSYLESGWWTFKQMWNKGLVYKGTKPVHWCPRCGTACAGYEVTDSYQDLTDPAVYVKFRLKNDDSFLLVFTTTPWTLLSNVAIGALPSAKYVKVKTKEGNLILAEKRLEFLDRIKLKYKVLSKFKGKKLEGEEYLPLFNTNTQKSLDNNQVARKVYMSVPILKERLPPKSAEKLGLKSGDVYEEFVSVEEGTGLLHTAPGHGKTDNIFAKLNKLPELSPVDDEGNFTKEVGKYSGMYFKAADPIIISDLKKAGTLLYSEKITHACSVCWRCKTPLLFMLSTQWFFNTSKVRKKVLSEHEKVRWLPGFAKERMATWLINYEDWNFTRQRFWGIPVPIFECSSCDNKIAIESKKELEKYLKKKLPKNYDLHEIGRLKIKCGCNGTLRSIGDIFDVWFDSGIAPWAWMGAPYKNKDQFLKYFPVDRVSEATDQIRGWFFSLLYIAVAVFGKAPYKTVSLPAFAVDSKGEKMSKSIGNAVWADEGIDNLGADLIRFYYSSNTPPYELAKFNINEVRRETFSTINTLWNLHNYLKNEYPSINSHRITKIEDKWIISRLNSLIKEYHNAFDKFEYQKMGRGLNEFIVNDLSRTYIQLVRGRIEKKDPSVGYVLFGCLLSTLKLLAPISPFVSDKIYLNLKNYSKVNEKSVHLERLPASENSRIDKKLENEFEVVREMISDVLALRDKLKRSLRWPIKEVVVVSDSNKVTSSIRKNVELISKQINTTKLLTKRTVEGLTYSIKLNYRDVGKRYGKLTNNIAKALDKIPVETALLGVKGSGIRIKVGGSVIILKNKDVSIVRKLPSHLFGLSKQDYVLYITQEETPSMLKSGFSREIIRKIQDIRKAIKLNRSDKIVVEVKTHEGINIDEEYIKRKVNALSIKRTNKLSRGRKEKFIVRGKLIELSVNKSL